MTPKILSIWLGTQCAFPLYAQQINGANVGVALFKDAPLFEILNPLTITKMVPMTLASINIHGFLGQKAPPVVFISTTPSENAIAVPLLKFAIPPTEKTETETMTNPVKEAVVAPIINPAPPPQNPTVEEAVVAPINNPASPPPKPLCRRS